MAAEHSGVHDPQRIADCIAENGYCIVPALIPPAQADAARQALERLLQAEMTAEIRAAKTQRLGGIVYKDPIFADILQNPTLVAIWQTYLQDQDIVCSTWSANTSYPGYEELHWHADYPYFWINQPWPLEKMCGQSILMLDDFTAENGGTGFVPGSHRRGQMPPAAWRDKFPQEAQILTGSRGSALLFHGALWHSARPNRSAKARSALLGMYTRPFYLPMEDMLAQLQRVKKPTPLLRQLLGANRYQPGAIGG